MTVADMLNTYSTVGNREDLSDVIAELFADDVPFFAILKKTQAQATKHEWTDDNLAAASSTGKTEGHTITYAKPALRTRHQNYTQIMERNWEVTHTQQAVKTAGVKQDVKREIMKAMKALLRDYDKIFLNSAGTAAGTTATARTCRGIQSAILTNTAVGTGAGNSANIALTEASVNARLQEIWNAGGDPRALFCGGYQKRVISNNFTAKTGFTFNVEASARKAINNINQYEGSFGTLDIIPDRQHLIRRVTIVDPNLLRRAVLYDITQYVGAKTSSSIKGWVESEQTLNWGNEKGHAKITFLKTTGVL